jgi:hypothetical protein
MPPCASRTLASYSVHSMSPSKFPLDFHDRPERHLARQHALVSLPSGRFRSSSYSIGRREPQRLLRIDHRDKHLVLCEGAAVSHAHCGVCDITKHSAMKRAHRIRETRAGLEFDRGAAGLAGCKRQTRQLADGDRKFSSRFLDCLAICSSCFSQSHNHEDLIQ